MKKSKMVTVLATFIAATVCMSVVAMSTSAENTSQNDNEVSEEASQKLYIAESSSTELPASEPRKDAGEHNRVLFTKEELKAIEENEASEEAIYQERIRTGNCDSIDIKRYRLIQAEKEARKSDLLAYGVMKKYVNGFKHDAIITDRDVDIECMHSMVELLKKNIVTDSEKQLLKSYVERRTNWLADDLKLREEFTKELESIG